MSPQPRADVPHALITAEEHVGRREPCAAGKLRPNGSEREPGFVGAFSTDWLPMRRTVLAASDY